MTIPFRPSVKTLAASANAVGPDNIFIIPTAAGARVLTLGPVAENTRALIFVKRVGANLATILPQAGEFIDGAPALTLSFDGQGFILACDGTAWRIVSSSQGPPSPWTILSVAASGAVVAPANPTELRVDTTAGLVNLTLPDATAIAAHPLAVKKVAGPAGNRVRLTPFAGQTIDGASPLDIILLRDVVTILPIGAAGWDVI